MTVLEDACERARLCACLRLYSLASTSFFFLYASPCVGKRGRGGGAHVGGPRWRRTPQERPHRLSCCLSGHSTEDLLPPPSPHRDGAHHSRRLLRSALSTRTPAQDHNLAHQTRRKVAKKKRRKRSSSAWVEATAERRNTQPRKKKK